MDDFLCDNGNGIGWSNCNDIDSKYHGPLSNRNSSNTLSRDFECTASSSRAQISFSLAFDCNNAFSDEIQLFIDNISISHYNPFPIEATTDDPTLLNISKNCEKWFIRHITYSLSLINNKAFELKFVAFLQSNIENIVLYNIQIQCIQQPTHSPSIVSMFYSLSI